jgi:hypothetical protein
VKAISLWEPWASLMACGAKKVETRSWPIFYRGSLLICASKHPMDAMAMMVQEMAAEHGFSVKPRYGMALCVVQVVGCERIRFHACGDGLEYELGDYTPGRFAWITEDLTAIDPFPVRGSQGLFDVPDNLIVYHKGGCQ